MVGPKGGHRTVPPLNTPLVAAVSCTHKLWEENSVGVILSGEIMPGVMFLEMLPNLTFPKKILSKSFSNFFVILLTNFLLHLTMLKNHKICFMFIKLWP